MPELAAPTAAADDELLSEATAAAIGWAPWAKPEEDDGTGVAVGAVPL